MDARSPDALVRENEALWERHNDNMRRLDRFETLVRWFWDTFPGTRVDIDQFLNGRKYPENLEKPETGPGASL